MNGIERRFQTQRARMDEDAIARSKALRLPNRVPPVSRSIDADKRIVYVTRPEPIVPEARVVHEYLSDTSIPEVDRMRMKQMVMMLLAMARGERGA